MLRKWIYPFLLLFAVPLEAAIKVGLLTYPPYVNGAKIEDRGVVIDLIQSLQIPTEDIELIILPPKRAFQDYHRQQLDMVFTSEISQSRAVFKNNHFLKLFNADTVLFFKNDPVKGRSVNQLRRKKSVAIIRGVKEERKVLLRDGFDILEVDSPKQGIKVLLGDRVSFLHMSKVPILILLEKMLSPAERAKIQYRKDVYLKNAAGLYYRKNAAPAVMQLAKRIETLVKDDDALKQVIRKTVQDPYLVQNLLP